MKKSIALGMAMVSLMATPALAEGMVTSNPSTSQTMSMNLPTAYWVATFDNQPENLMLFGVAKVPANEGVLDRVIRLVAGAGLVYATSTQQNNWPTAGTVAGYTVGGLGLLTGLTGYCAIYHLAGINTRF